VEECKGKGTAETVEGDECRRNSSVEGQKDVVLGGGLEVLVEGQRPLHYGVLTGVL